MTLENAAERFYKGISERSRTLWNILRWVLLVIAILFIGGYIGIVFIFLGEIYGHYRQFHQQIVVWIHITSGSIILIFGLLQFIPQIRQRWPKFHIVNGYIVFVVAIISGASAFATCFWAYGGAPVALSGGVVALWWLLTVIMGYVRIMQKDIQSHREWMIRFIALAYSIIAIRIVVIIAMTKWNPSVSIGAGIPVTFLVFILGAELYIQHNKPRSNSATLIIDGEMHITMEKWQKLKLVSKTQLSHNTSSFVFELPHPSMRIDVPAGRHMLLRVHTKGGNIIRPYSPINLETRSGVLEFVIKKYAKGKMSSFLHDVLQVGEQVEFKGPTGTFEYTANAHEQVVLMAGGTGITPIISIASAILKNPFDTTQVTLFYANQTSSDTILLEELREIAAQDSKRFKFIPLLSRAAIGDLDFEHGRIGEALVKKNAPEPSKKVQVIICGPHAMSIAMLKLMARLKYSKNSMVALGVTDH